MLVTRVLGDCPGCGGKSKFGNVSVRGNFVLRGCMSCKYRTTVSLPALRKKILYLDQFFFSSAFHERDPRFVKAAARIREISAMQLLVAPFSSIHEDETHLWRGYDGKNKDNLMEFIKTTSRGHKFERRHNVEQTQIVRAFKAFVSEKGESHNLQDRDAVAGDIHGWDDYFRIDVGRYIGDIELMRDLKRQSIENLVDVFPSWRNSTNTFEQDVAAEVRAAAKGYLESYIQHAARLISGDYNALFDSPEISMVVESLLHCLPDNVPLEGQLERIGAFFKSSHFSEVPFIRLSARIYATLKAMVKRGAYVDRVDAIRRLSGFFLDVKHVSTYAPYCDAFIVDQAMASIVADPLVGLERAYAVRVYSLNNWDKFLSWLDGLESAMTPEHRAGLVAAYQ
ncbi:MAG: hypothetical protein FJ249_07535 [Nitrospira sp.]|nr:hypothetical protein [Nitrospira sp.]